MNNYSLFDSPINISPQASTEEKSIHDNFDFNKQSLEKGLLNRPSQGLLVDRGILRNPGKAYSEKIHQLDLAKKRDSLKKKIETRPERDELVRKLILPDCNDNRKSEKIRIMQILDDSFRHRPGSLELVDKNILQVDRLLASQVHNGDIEYPRVHGNDNDISLDSDITSTPHEKTSINCFPPFTSYSYQPNSNNSNISFNSNSSSINVSESLSELSNLITKNNNYNSAISNNNISIVNNHQTFTTQTTSTVPTISCRKTCKVGKYSFHNVEFHPQKAREYQQRQLIQFQEIQDERIPSMRKLHSELRSCRLNNGNINNNSKSNNGNVSTRCSLLHRLNVNELKSECKIRQIPCSNIPKVQLVEKLLAFEQEILATHSSFNGTGKSLTSAANTRSPLNSCSSETTRMPSSSVSSCNVYNYSPNSILSTPYSNNNYSPQNHSQHQSNNPNLVQFLPTNYTTPVIQNVTNRIIHSNSEPVIHQLNYTDNNIYHNNNNNNNNNNNDIASVQFSNSHFSNQNLINYQLSNAPKLCYTELSNSNNINNNNNNNRHSLIFDQRAKVEMTYEDASRSLNGSSSSSLSQNNMSNSLNYTNPNHSNMNISNIHSIHQNGQSEYVYHPNSSISMLNHINNNDDNNQQRIMSSDFTNHNISSPTFHIPPIPNKCDQKFKYIKQELMNLSLVIQNINSLNAHNQPMNNDLLKNHRSILNQLAIKTKETIGFVNKELEFNTLNTEDYHEQINWLNYLMDCINNNINNQETPLKKEEEIAINSILIEHEVENFHGFSSSNNMVQIDDLSSDDFMFPHNDLDTPDMANSPMQNDDVLDDLLGVFN